MKFYAHPQSPPCRAVHMTLAVLDKEAEYVYMDLFKGAHKEPEFLKLNPQHNVPVIEEDNGFTMNESRAIQEYLVSKYASEARAKELLGEDLETRSIVQQRLYFDATSLFNRFAQKMVMPIVFRKEKISEEQRKSMQEVFGWMEDMVKPTGYIAGTKTMTIADISILATVTTIQTTKDLFVDWSQYPELLQWMDRIKSQIPNYAKTNQEGVDVFEKFFYGAYDAL